MKNNIYKHLTSLLAAGLACAAVLIGSLTVTAPASEAGENTPGREPLIEISDDGDSHNQTDANNGTASPCNDRNNSGEQYDFDATSS